MKIFEDCFDILRIASRSSIFSMLYSARRLNQSAFSSFTFSSLAKNSSVELPDRNHNTDQTCSCPRACSLHRHKKGPLFNPAIYYSVVKVWEVSGGLSCACMMPRHFTLSDSCKVFAVALNLKHRRGNFAPNATRLPMFSESWFVEPIFRCNYAFPIDLTPNGIPFGSKSIGKV